ncbi:hypothetical protein OROMI_017885 [Orobanche minor]
MEELSLSFCTGLVLSSTNLYEPYKLSRLYLHRVKVDAMFFTDFASRFPCLKDLTILHCGFDGDTRIQIASTSFETIRFEPMSESQNEATFEVPNIHKFTYSSFGIPSKLSIKVGSSREWEWELNISLIFRPVDDKSWYLKLRNFLTKFRLSRTYLSLSLLNNRFEHDEVGIEVVAEPAVVENLMIDTPPSSFASILYHVFGICCPKFITQDGFSNIYNSFEVVYKRLMHRVITPNCGIPDRDLFEKFGLKKVNMEVYDMNGTNRLPDLLLKTPLDVTKPPKNNQKVRFELIWD